MSRVQIKYDFKTVDYRSPYKMHENSNTNDEAISPVTSLSLSHLTDSSSAALNSILSLSFIEIQLSCEFMYMNERHVPNNIPYSILHFERRNLSLVFIPTPNRAVSCIF